jgi:hypothetical protein
MRRQLQAHFLCYFVGFLTPQPGQFAQSHPIIFLLLYLLYYDYKLIVLKCQILFVFLLRVC